MGLGAYIVEGRMEGGVEVELALMLKVMRVSTTGPLKDCEGNTQRGWSRRFVGDEGAGARGLHHGVDLVWFGEGEGGVFLLPLGRGQDPGCGGGCVLQQQASVSGLAGLCYGHCGSVCHRERSLEWEADGVGCIGDVCSGCGLPTQVVRVWWPGRLNPWARVALGGVYPLSGAG